MTNKIFYSLSSDRTSVVMTVMAPDGKREYTIIDGPEFDDLIDRLALIRAAMLDGVPEELEPNTRSRIVQHPAFKVELPRADSSEVFLWIRHPAFGWLKNLLAVEQAVSLGRLLNASQIMRNHGKDFVNARSPISPEQSRAARACLKWTRDRLAEASGVTSITIAKFENGNVSHLRSTLSRIRIALEAAGIEFIGGTGNAPGVRMRENIPD